MKVFSLIVLLLSLNSFALEGLSNLEFLMFDKNLDYQSQVDFVNSKKTLVNAGYSGFYPTLNAVGGWGKSRTDEIATDQKGYLGYIEGSVNLFRGFKDLATNSQKEADYQLSELDLEIKKRELKLQLTEVVSDMIYLHKLQDILKEELNVTLSQRQMAAKKVSGGLTGSVDHLELDLRENEIEIEIKQIDQLHSENHQKLVKIFGEEVKDADLDKVSFSELSKLSRIENLLNIKMNIKYKKSELLRNKYDLEKREIKSEFLPSLDFAYAQGRLTPSEETSTKLNEYKYSLTLSIPLFSGFDTYYKNKSATALLSSIEKQKSQNQIETEAEFKILITKLKDTVSLNEINERKLKNSQKYFELTLGEYKRGIKNSPDLVGATDRLFSTKKRKYELLKELEILKIKIENLL